MIIKDARLRLGLQDWAHRNQLMRELNLADGKKKEAMWCLAFLLGEKSAYRKILRSARFSVQNSHLTIVQYFVISLDRIIDNLSVQEFDGTNNKFTLRELKETRFNVLNHFNHHYETDSERVVLIKEIIDILNKRLTDLGVHPNTQQMIANLLESIDLSAPSYLTDTIYPQDSSPHYPALMQTGSTMQRRGLEVVMKSNNKHWLLDISNSLNKTYDFQTHYLQSRDGTTIDGLWVKKKGKKKKTVVLALVGHFQTEHSYLSDMFIRFYEFFNTDIIFLNPRNYSQHAGVKATRIEDVVSDVLAYTDFADKQYKHIILYGMCGGAPFMTLAAEKLEKTPISYKVIIDRFTDSYSTFANKKTIERGMALAGTDTTSLKRGLERYVTPLRYMPDFSFNLLLNLSLHALSMTRQSLIMYLGMNFSLVDRLKTIPFEKRLVLQAKSKKIPGKSVPEYTDLIVHPEHDMRHAFKDTRHQKRVILKQLSYACLTIALKLPQSSTIYHELMRLSKIFTACLQTIDNEKLKLDSRDDEILGTDLHGEKLFELKTRNEQPIERFIQSFCLFSTNISKKPIVKLHRKRVKEIHESVNGILPDFDFTRDMAKELKLIFDTVYDNRDFILPLAERVRSGERYDLDAVYKSLQSMLKTPEPNPEIVEAIRA